MKKTVISLNLSATSINQAIRQLNNYKKDINQKCKLLAEKLADIGVEQAKVSIVDYNAIDAGKLYNSIKRVRGRKSDGFLVFVRADCKYAVYVEMGTGIMGWYAPYKGAIPVIYTHGNTTGKGKKIHKASKAEAHASPYINEGDPVWWYYKNGKWHITKGQYSKPFMYEASQEMRRKVHKVVREVFG